MNDDLILARFGELTIKGRNRGRFEDMMVRQVKKALSPFQRLSYKKTFGRLYIGLNGEDYPRIAERLT
ncbi:MAG: thiI, partial [Cohnella sp.]|nr:thiI [Cohnella sp.]